MIKSFKEIFSPIQWSILVVLSEEAKWGGKKQI